MVICCLFSTENLLQYILYMDISPINTYAFQIKENVIVTDITVYGDKTIRTCNFHLGTATLMINNGTLIQFA